MKGYPLVKKRLLRLWLIIDRQLSEVLRLVLLWVATVMSNYCFWEMARSVERASKALDKVTAWGDLAQRFEKSRVQLEADR